MLRTAHLSAGPGHAARPAPARRERSPGRPRPMRSGDWNASCCS